MSKKTLSLDFDGVCHRYDSPWQGPTVIPDEPVEGLFEFLTSASEHFVIEIYSTRSETREGRGAMKTWFHQEAKIYIDKIGLEDPSELWLAIDNLRFPESKPKAFVGLDDRILTFEGKWPELSTLINWKPWNKRGLQTLRDRSQK
jgi:hypothetical protein